MDSTRKRRRARIGLVLGGLVLAGTVGAGVVVASIALDGPVATQDKAGPVRPAGPGPAARPTGSGPMTPGRARPLRLIPPTGQKNGASTGFPRGAMGALSAAVYRHEEYAWYDDVQARRQLEVTTSRDSLGWIDTEISRVRALRSAAGLPPSGDAPAGLTVTTSVVAARGRSLVADGSVVQIWLSYERHAVFADQGPDNDPLLDESEDVILKWEDGDWKRTTEERYTKLRTFPVAYAPDSPYAWADGWVQVVRVD
ncbi:hypothetical protein ACFYUJ_39115 [Streptomyces sp. NPDC004520]|uniref:hypothetical protein n=1 Tax=Streptomyces sp. NPDC004520 TaxID=3364702 RepID=UPI0036B495E0